MYRKIIKVFLASPGDLEAERKAAKQIVDEENINYAHDLGYQIDLVGWEDTVSQRRRAQDAINRDLDQCEYFVGLMWKKWGTPPGTDGHPYTSGFEEEYSRSVLRHDQTGKPQVSLLFRAISSDDLIDVGQQLAKVLAFQENINKEKKQYYQKFSELRDFEQKFRSTIAKFLKDQQLEDHKSKNSGVIEARPHAEPKNQEETSIPGTGIFEESARAFIQNLTDESTTSDDVDAASAARFRLLASTVSSSGNDKLLLGTHDANLVYRDLRSSELTSRERRALIASGLETFEHESNPLWHWVFDPNTNPNSELPFRTIYGGTTQQKNTFKALETLAIRPSDFEGVFTSEELIDIWFTDGNSDELIVAALEYLGAFGSDEHASAWEKYLTSSEANVARAAVRTKIKIVAQSSISDALDFIATREDADIDDKLSKRLLVNVEGLETETIRKCLSNRSVAFRKSLAEELSRRSALSKDDAERLCESEDAQTRLMGVLEVKKNRPDLTLIEANKFLVKPKKSNTFSLFATNQNRDFNGEVAFERYKRSVLGEVEFNRLKELRKEESFYEDYITLATYSAHFKRIRGEIEANLKDGFRSYCDEKRSRLVDASNDPSTSVYDFVRGKTLQSAFEIFCSKAGKFDLELVRKVLDQDEVKLSVTITEFLRKYGEWEDSKRIASLSFNPRYSGLGGLGTRFENNLDEYEAAARALLKIGSKRIADVWQLSLPPLVRVSFVTHMPKNRFQAFDDHRLIEMLKSDSDKVRQVVALKAVLSLSKRRLKSLLDDYFVAEGTFFYNAIFWLDLGISADKTTAKMIAKNKLATG